MKTINIVVPFLLLGIAIPGRLGSSDFSKLAEPGFARSMMISSERQIEVRCAALAYLPYRKLEVYDVAEALDHSDEQTDEMIADADARLTTPPFADKLIVAKSENQPVDSNAPDDNMSAPLVVNPVPETGPQIVFEKLLSEEQAEKLHAAVLSRLQSDIGDDEWALQTLESRYGWLAPQWDFSAESIAEKAKFREKLKPECLPIFDAASADMLDTILSPPSDKPIALPDLNTCLAYDVIARASAKYADYNILHERHGDSLYERIVGPKGRKRKAREMEIAAHAATLSDIEPDVAAVRLMTCLPTFSFAFRE